jgi:hypothetical protein
VTTVLGWCLSTDTDPWQALAHRWPLAAATTLAATLAAAAAALGRRRRGGAPPVGLWLRGLMPTLAAVGIAVVLPALTVWDAATSAGATDDPAGKAATALVAGTAAAAVSVAFWYGAGMAASCTALTGAGVAAMIGLLSGSVLAAALPAALLLPRTQRAAADPGGGDDDPQPDTVVASTATARP